MSTPDKTYFTADTHFEHEAIRVHCGRPHMTIDQMNDALVENWNSVVPKKGALVYILGDFAWKNHARWLHKLNGKKVLIKGNHDDMNQKTYDLFREVTPLKDIKIEKVKVTLCHYGMMSWNCSPWGAWHLYGHSHGRLPHKGLAMDVGVDCNNYTPVSWETIKKIMCEKADKLILEYNPDVFAYKRINPNYGLALVSHDDPIKAKQQFVKVFPVHGTQVVEEGYDIRINNKNDRPFIQFIGEEQYIDEFKLR